MKTRKEAKRKVSWWGLAVAIFFIGISFIEIKALNPDEISGFERAFWWVCLIFWTFTGAAIIITKIRKKKKGGDYYDE